MQGSIEYKKSDMTPLDTGECKLEKDATKNYYIRTSSGKSCLSFIGNR